MCGIFINSFQGFEIVFLKNKKKKGKEEKIFNYFLDFYCAFPTFTGLGSPGEVLQSLAPQTMSSVADP